MAKELASDSIMPADKMKPLLALSKREPVQAAIGLTGEGDAVLLLDKKAKPRKVMSMLRASAGKAKLPLNTGSLRFGRAEVDPDYDPSMVRFFVNKEAPGNMRVRLVELVKRAAFQKVEINVDPTLEEESDDEREESQPEEQPAPTVTSPPGTDELALHRELKELVGRIPAAAGQDAARRAVLIKVANAENDLLKSHNLDGVGRAIAKLREAIGARGPTGPQPSAGGPEQTVADPLALWRDAKETLDGRLNALAAKLREFGDVDFDQIADKGLFGLTSGGQTVGLMKALMAYNGASPDQKPAIGAQLREAVGRYRSELESSNLVDLIDDNPFGVKIGLFATLDGALRQIESSLPSS